MLDAGAMRKPAGQSDVVHHGCFAWCYPLHSIWFHALG